MSTNEQDMRQIIINSVKEMLAESGDARKITVRQIAERAGTSIGSINYHFKTKDNLLRIAIGDDMVRTIKSFAKDEVYRGMEPIVKLKKLVKELCVIGEKNEKLMSFMILQEITDGSMEAPLHLIPLLREIFGSQKEELQLRLIALQIVQPIQVSVVNNTSFHMYSGIDITNTAQRDRFIDTLIDNVMKP